MGRARFSSWHRGTALSLAASIFCTGCVKTQVDMVGRSTPSAPIVQPVKRLGVYEAKWTPDDKSHLKPLAGISRRSFPGDDLGFARADDGSIVAVRNNERIALNVPRNAKYVVWYHSERVPTHFAIRSQRIAEEVGDTTGKILVGAGVVALLGLVLYLDLNQSDDCNH